MEAKLNEILEGMKEKLIDYRRDFHKHPESGWSCFRTASKIIEKLDKLGFSIKMGREVLVPEKMLGLETPERLKEQREEAVKQGADPQLVEKMGDGMTGIVADLECGDGPLVAFRFDIDSNDIEEVKDEKHRPFKEGFNSVNKGRMHACGHDGHAAVGLCFAEVITKIKDELNCRVRLIFQPGEEGLRGARAMVDAKIVDDVDYIFGFHLGFQAKKRGKLICSTGDFLASTKLDAKYDGLASHAGAAPEKGRNALLAASSAVVNLHAISRHSEGASRITVGTLEAGQGRNIIPPNAFMRLETRGLTTEINNYMQENAERILKSTAEMYDLKCDIKEVGYSDSGESSQELLPTIKQAAKESGCFEELVDYISFGASEDYAVFMTRVQNKGGQGTYFMVGTDLPTPHHNEYFDINEDSLLDALKINTNILKSICK